MIHDPFCITIEWQFVVDCLLKNAFNRNFRVVMEELCFVEESILKITHPKVLSKNLKLKFLKLNVLLNIK